MPVRPLAAAIARPAWRDLLSPGVGEKPMLRVKNGNRQSTGNLASTSYHDGIEPWPPIKFSAPVCACWRVGVMLRAANVRRGELLRRASRRKYRNPAPSHIPALKAASVHHGGILSALPPSILSREHRRRIRKIDERRWRKQAGIGLLMWGKASTLSKMPKSSSPFAHLGIGKIARWLACIRKILLEGPGQ